MSSYWTRISSHRINRRRALASSAGAAAAAAFLAACGSDGGGDEGEDKSGLLTKPVDTSSQAKPGQSLTLAILSEARTLDPINNGLSTGTNQSYAYSRFAIDKTGHMASPEMGATDLDLAQSFEQSPDGLRLTIKLREDAKFDLREPTNGRAMNSEDVKWSWERYAAVSLTRSELVNALSPFSPIESLEVLDAKTVSFKLAFPMANMMGRFAFHRYLHILPIEADGKFDPKIEQRGTGPWMLRKAEPSLGYTYDRNPNWHLRKGQPYLETLNLRLMSEYAQRRAQLQQGTLLTSAIAAYHLESQPPDDVVAVKQEQPKLNLYAKLFPVFRDNQIVFGYAPGSPFHDVRVRRAASMLIDRDAWINTFYNVADLEAQGIPVESRWHSHYMAGEKPHWIDPQGNGLGEGAAYFKLNPEEATKQVRAAGINAPIKLPGYSMATLVGAAQKTEVFQQMLNNGGLFDIAIQTLPVNEHNLKISNGQGNFEGIAFDQSSGQGGDIDQYLTVRYFVGAGGTQANFPSVFPWYEKTQGFLEAQRRELDNKKRASLLVDLQKEMALQMPSINYPGAATGFVLAWPQLANMNVWTPGTGLNDPTEVYPHLWFDESKVPV